MQYHLQVAKLGNDITFQKWLKSDKRNPNLSFFLPKVDNVNHAVKGDK